MNQSYSRFKFQENHNYATGWDAFAIDYSSLLQPDTVYTLTKQVMYAIVQKHVDLKKDMQVLDVNCGTGNDFPYFLSKECRITGCDISTGMLNKASETYREQIADDRVRLFQGALEDLRTSDFAPESFDVIYSITGGFSYIDHAEMLRVFKCLRTFLKPNGKIITAHFGRFALAESLFYFKKLRFKEALIRRKSKIHVRIKNKNFVMHLQKHQALTKLFRNDFKIDGVHPLLFRTPPYQTKFKPDVSRLNKLREIELNYIDKKRLANFSDQFVLVLSKK